MSKKAISHKSLNSEDYITKLNEELTMANNAGNIRLTILILHIYTEYWINEIIQICFTKPQRIIKKKYSEKIELLEDLGYIKNNFMINSLELLGKMRNDCAHALNLTILKRSIKGRFQKWVKNLSKEEKEFISKTGEEWQESLKFLFQGRIIMKLMSYYKDAKQAKKICLKQLESRSPNIQHTN